MDREEALKLLKGGEEGICEWNERREAKEEIPSLEKADLGEANFSEADLSRADLSEADLRGTVFCEANLNEAILRKANLSGASPIHANFSGADLSSADISCGCLCGADLSGTNLSGAILSGADLSNANFSEANLSRADLSETDLRGADFYKSDLSRTKLSESDLAGADFSNAYCYRTIWADVDLSFARGLEKVTHHGPSSIGIDTIYKSQGKIPENFLRGCGIPENLNEHLSSLVPSITSGPSVLQFYSCFISHSHQDEEFSKFLHSRMQAEKLRVWCPPEELKSREKIHEQIGGTIQLHDKLILVLTEKSMSSEWIATEISIAQQREAQVNLRTLFPIRLVPIQKIKDWECFAADTGKDVAYEVRKYFIPDFSNWKKHDSFQEGFKRLLSDLQTEQERRLYP